MFKNKTLTISLFGGLALALIFGGASLFGFIPVANAAEMTAQDVQSTTRSSTRPGFLGEGTLAHGGWGRGGFGSTIDHQQLLADALGITLEELQAAREQANLAAIEQAIAEGIITQEQADEMQSRRHLQAYLDRDTLLAKALDLTVEELKAALADGKTLTTLMSERNLDAATVRENLAAARDEAIAQAVADGVITQEQADNLKDGPGLGMVRPGGPGMRGGHHGRGDFEGRFPGHPDREDFSGIEFHRPGRAIQADSDL